MRGRLAERALDWLEASLEQFDPFAAGPTPDALRNKAFAELAFFCDYVRRAHPESIPRVQRMLAFVAGVWARAEYRDLIVRNPESLQLYVLTYDSLLHSGFPVSDCATTIQDVIDAGYATSIEAVPFRLMDLRHVLDYGGFRHSLPTMRELFRRTLLSSRPPLFYLSNADVYCLTHTIFYLTDFGFSPPAFVSRDDVAYYRDIVDQLLGLFVRLRDWDLTAELLVCRRCLGSDQNLIEDAAWEGLVHAQLADGCVPAPRYDPNGPEARRSSSTYAFEHNYHTTLVAALAASLC